MGSKGSEKRRFYESISFREERGEEDGVWDFFRVGFWGEGYRNRERGFRVGFVEKFDYGWREKERASGLLVEKILPAYYYYFFNLINADVENCGSSKIFGYIYIYI